MEQFRSFFNPRELYATYFQASSSDATESEVEVVLLGGSVNKRTRDGSAKRKPIDKQLAPWQRMLDANAGGINSIDDETSRDGKYFRRRFRMPHSLFKSLIQVMLDEQVPCPLSLVITHAAK